MQSGYPSINPDAELVLVFPPSAKPSEPPAGLARLAGALGRYGVRHTVIDANLEGQLWLMRNARPGIGDTWTRRAYRNVEGNIRALRDRATYGNFDRYSRAVVDLNRVLSASANALEHGVTLGLANYQHRELAPVRSADLLATAERPQDSPFYPYFSARLTGAIENSRAKILGFSVNYLNQALPAFAMAGHVRRHYPHVRIVMGGGLVTSWLSRPGWKSPFSGLVDTLVSGPGEGALLAMFDFEKKEREHFCPDFSGFPLDEYLSPGLVIPYSGSGGCWWGKCSFCPEHAEQNPYHGISGQNALSDIRSAGGTPSLLHLLDNAVSPALMNAMIEDSPGIPWYGFARVTKDLANDEYCASLKRSGCVMLKLGLESGDQGVLDALHKGIDLETVSRALRALDRAGIVTYVYLLFGTPPEGEEEARRTLQFVREHAGDIGFLNLAVFNMPAFGPDVGKFRTNTFSEGDLSLYCDFVHPCGWDRSRVRRFLEDEFRRDSVVANILKRTPPVFTSNHAAFFAHDVLQTRPRDEG